MALVALFAVVALVMDVGMVVVVVDDDDDFVVVVVVGCLGTRGDRHVVGVF